MTKTKRLHRSELAVPVITERFLRTAAQCKADAIFLDLEDTVPDSRKQEARGLAIRALNEIDWGTRTLSVRVNALDTQWGYRDIVEIAEASPRLDLILLPKPSGPHDVKCVEILLDGVEKATGRSSPIGIEVLIETPEGLENVEAIAASTPRLEAMIFGIGDYSIALGVPDARLGSTSPLYRMLTPPDDEGKRVTHWNDRFHYAMARIANTCRAHGLRLVDGPYGNFSDMAGYRAAAERALALGYEGKWAIHPSQIETANDVFSPTSEQIAWATRIVKSIDDAEKSGLGSFRMEGALVALAYLKSARAIMEKAQRIDPAGLPS